MQSQFNSFLEKLSNNQPVSRTLKMLGFKTITAGDEPKTKITKLSKWKILNHDLSDEFNEAEYEFVKPIAIALAKDDRVNQAFSNWSQMPQEERENFTRFVTLKFSELTGLKKPLVNFVITSNKKTEGSFSKIFFAINFKKDLMKYDTPLELMSIAAHEHLGHLRQFLNDYRGKRPELDIEILNAQMNNGKRYPKKYYFIQPVEHHARNASDFFTMEFVKAFNEHNEALENTQKLPEHKSWANILLEDIKERKNSAQVNDQMIR